MTQVGGPGGITPCHVCVRLPAQGASGTSACFPAGRGPVSLHIPCPMEGDAGAEPQGSLFGAAGSGSLQREAWPQSQQAGALSS